MEFLESLRVSGILWNLKRILQNLWNYLKTSDLKLGYLSQQLIQATIQTTILARTKC
ncbi:hypothetical protein BCL90_3874 [Pedobacter alluvionis]|uniref:Uncharacterized protein n=1 Tax=Pedobacter alluvionis TaxID=475253 RepID=A0A497Y0Y7_9SPHI|nr:hypothetical protein BCL90_3874 [Pedobacter alluvionis]